MKRENLLFFFVLGIIDLDSGLGFNSSLSFPKSWVYETSSSPPLESELLPGNGGAVAIFLAPFYILISNKKTIINWIYKGKFMSDLTICDLNKKLHI